VLYEHPHFCFESLALAVFRWCFDHGWTHTHVFDWACRYSWGVLGGPVLDANLAAAFFFFFFNNGPCIAVAVAVMVMVAVFCCIALLLLPAYYPQNLPQTKRTVGLNWKSEETFQR
jgi:hypothetical protein